MTDAFELIGAKRLTAGATLFDSSLLHGSLASKPHLDIAWSVADTGRASRNADGRKMKDKGP